VDGVDLRRLWPQVLEVIGQGSKAIRAMLEGSQVVDSTNDTITLAVAPSLAKRLAEERNAGTIATAVTSLIGGAWKIAIQPAGGKPSGDSGPSTTISATEPDPRDDPDYEPGAPPAAAPVDPETEAMRLLQDQLDARPLDG
jgi:DNA polymerase-3 subunit gamma/tau